MGPKMCEKTSFKTGLESTPCFLVVRSVEFLCRNPEREEVTLKVTVSVGQKKGPKLPIGMLTIHDDPVIKQLKIGVRK
jgi:hypothetical protein